MARGRPKGSKQINKQLRLRTCARCNNSMQQWGSGKPKKYCCKPPKTFRKLQGTPMSRGNEQVIQDKLQRGECALHPRYHEGRRKFVTIENHPMFEYDHIDRANKKGTIAKLKDSGPRQLSEELKKCQLLCSNCHAMKTYESKDWRKHNYIIEEHPTLFDEE